MTTFSAHSGGIVITLSPRRVLSRHLRMRLPLRIGTPTPKITVPRNDAWLESLHLPNCLPGSGMPFEPCRSACVCSGHITMDTSSYFIPGCSRVA